MEKESDEGEPLGLLVKGQEREDCSRNKGGFVAACRPARVVTAVGQAVEMMWVPERVWILDQDLEESGLPTTNRENFKTLVVDGSSVRVRERWLGKGEPRWIDSVPLSTR